jgi:signal transduction histidine kinase
VAHDLNNYLAIVDLSLTAAQNSVVAIPTSELKQAREAMQGAKRLTHGLLEYARGGSPSPQSTDFGALVRRTLELFGRLIPEDIVLVLNIDPMAPRIRGVRAELEQLVLNLVLNACESMPLEGVLTVSVAGSREAGVTLEVTDTGPGLSVGIAVTNGPTTPSNKQADGASGLGLGIVKYVAARHAATLEIGARLAGSGTRMVVRFAAESEPL